MAERAANAAMGREIGAVVVGRVAVSVLDSAKTFILLRLVDKAGYGTLAFALAWYGTAVGFGALALPDSLMALLPKYTPSEQRGLVRQTLRTLGAVGATLGLGILAATWVPSALPSGQPQLVQVLPWVALAVAADMPAQALQAFLLGIKRHREASLRALAMSGLANLSLVLPVLLGHGPVAVLACYAAACCIRLLVTLWSYRQAFAGIAAQRPAGGIVAQLGFAVPLSLNGLVGMCNRQLATWVAGLLLPAVAFADFAAGGQELPFVAMIPNAVAVALLPHLSSMAVGEQGRADALKLWHASMLRVALLMVPLWLLLTLEAESLLVVIGGEGYRTAALPFRITALLLPLRLTGYGTMLLALGMPRAVLRSQIWALAVNLGICGATVALARGGAATPTVLAGASLSFVAAQMAAIAVMLQQIGTATRVGWVGAFPWPGFVRVLGLALVPAVPLGAWHVVQPAPDLPGVPPLISQLLGIVVRAALFAAAWALLALRAGLVPPQDRAMVWAWLTLEPLRRRREKP